MGLAWKFTLLALCCAFPALAQTCSTNIRDWSHPLSSNMCPDDYQAWLKTYKPKPLHKNVQFWGGELLINAALALDAASTSKNHGYGYIESNPIGVHFVGTYPSNGRLIGVGIGADAVYTGLNVVAWKLVRKDPSKEWRFLGHWVVPAIAGSIHGWAAHHNYSLPDVKQP
jgi:hypothetical protein